MTPADKAKALAGGTFIAFFGWIAIVLLFASAGASS